MSSSASKIIARVPPRNWLDNGLILDCFMDALDERGIMLYEAQEEAILALFENHNVILNTPTGSGKSLVATALHLKSLSWGSRSVYTCPIKALVNEKFLALCRDFGARNVGIITGDSSVNADAPILCCTAEILSNMALRYGSRSGFDDVIMDEFHYYSDRDRGAAWQIPLLTMKDSRFLLMSATLGETDFFARKLTELNGLETDVVKSATRPVPLEYLYKEIPLLETLDDLIKTGKSPIYLVHFTQLEAAEQAQALTSLDLCTKDEKKEILSQLESVRFDSPYGKDMKRFLQHGIGLHHAGLLPKYRILVESLAQKGLLRVICGTDTLGVGINVPIRTVVFSQLCKFDGEKTTLLSVRDFQQIAGRAGRKGFDDSGTVVVQAPEHIVENIRLEQKASGDPKKLRKIVKKKPPQKGFLPWNSETFEKLTKSEPETLISRFRVNHAMLLNVLSRERGGVEALRALIRDCHETDVTKRDLRRSAWELFRALHTRGIIQLVNQEDRLPEHTPVKVNLELQLDFSLNQELSLFLVDAIALLDANDETYALRVLTIVESIQENPRVILRKQQNKAKSEKIAELKMAGLDYEDRMIELEKVDYPKPDAEWIYNCFHVFQNAHPWVAGENIRPKSIAREIYETLQTFDEYIREYELQRSEGILLRYLSDVYHALSQTVPDQRKNDDLWTIEDYLGRIVRHTDSSLLDEWKKLEGQAGLEPETILQVDESAALAEAQEREAKRLREITSLARNSIHRFILLLASSQFDAASDFLTHRDSHERWTADRLRQRMDVLNREKGGLLFNASSRAHKQTHFKRPNEHDSLAEGLLWNIEHTLLDESGDNDTCLHFVFDPGASEQTGTAQLSLIEFKEI